MAIKVNTLRRRLMRYLTKNIGASKNNQLTTIPKGYRFKRILVSRPNQRLGNLLLITPLLQEISETFPDCKIDLFVKGNLAPILFENYDNVDRIIKLPKKPFNNLFAYLAVWVKLRKNKYDLIINVDKNSSSGRLSTMFANSDLKFFCNRTQELEEGFSENNHIAKYPVYDFRNFLLNIGLTPNDEPVKPLDLKLSPNEIAEGKKILNELVQNEKPTILIFTYATGRKCYSEDWWREFYNNLKVEFQDNYNIVEVLPVENVSQISFQAPCFYSKDVREIGSFIANAAIYIGADGGIMHLASAVNTPTVGLFSVTKPEVYEPYNLNSMAVDTRKSDNAQIIQEVKTILKS